MVARGDEADPLFKWVHGHYVTQEKIVVHVWLALNAAGLVAKKCFVALTVIMTHSK
jgi:hypothetical protein